MSGQRDVIDLDEGDRESTEAGGVTPDRSLVRRRNVRLVAALLAGVVLGGVGVNELRDARDERQHSAAVSLLAFPASGGGGGGSGVEGVLQMDALLAVVNAGPAPVTLRVVAGQGPGVGLRDAGQSRLLRPGGVGWIEVELRLECANAFGSEPLVVRFSVETADRRAREATYPVAVTGSVWHRGAEVPCEHLR